MKNLLIRYSLAFLSKSCPTMPASICAVKLSSSIQRILSISVISRDTIGRISSGEHSRAPDTFVPPIISRTKDKLHLSHLQTE